MFTPGPLHIAAGSAAGILLGAAAGFAVTYGLGLFAIFLAFIYGGIAGGLILRASGRKRGIRMEILAGVSMTVGALGGRLLVAVSQLATLHDVHPHYGALDALVQLVQPSPLPLIALAVAIAAAVSRIRYM